VFPFVCSSRLDLKSNGFQYTKIPGKIDSDEKAGHCLGAVATTCLETDMSCQHNSPPWAVWIGTTRSVTSEQFKKDEDSDDVAPPSQHSASGQVLVLPGRVLIIVRQMHIHSYHKSHQQSPLG
jgi:hypothetical protein